MLGLQSQLSFFNRHRKPVPDLLERCGCDQVQLKQACNQHLNVLRGGQELAQNRAIGSNPKQWI
jgi:hypothetical protein